MPNNKAILNRKYYQRRLHRTVTNTGIQGELTTLPQARITRDVMVRDWRMSAGHSVRYSFLTKKHTLLKNGHEVMKVWIEQEVVHE